MPYNITDRFPEIIALLKRWGYEKEVHYREVKKAIMLVLGVTKPKKVEYYIELLCQFNFIKNATGHDPSRGILVFEVQNKKEWMVKK